MGSMTAWCQSRKGVAAVGLAAQPVDACVHEVGPEVLLDLIGRG
jgi:hypothetical protein